MKEKEKEENDETKRRLSNSKANQAEKEKEKEKSQTKTWGFNKELKFLKSSARKSIRNHFLCQQKYLWELFKNINLALLNFHFFLILNF